MEERQLHLSEDGVYSAKIDITVDEWKTMLRDERIFDENSLEMVKKWYCAKGHQSTHKAIMDIYTEKYAKHKRSPFNGIANGLADRVMKHLNRFYVKGVHTKRCYFIVPFEGWHENHRHFGPFVWKLRDELVRALEELKIVSEKPESSANYVAELEGKELQYLVTRHERNPRNRKEAIRIHGLSCCTCGFNFEKTYGEIGKDYIEVHHLTAVSDMKEEAPLDPKTELICLCSNCHSMIHSKAGAMLTPDELKLIIQKNTKSAF